MAGLECANMTTTIIHKLSLTTDPLFVKKKKKKGMRNVNANAPKNSPRQIFKSLLYPGRAVSGLCLKHCVCIYMVKIQHTMPY